MTIPLNYTLEETLKYVDMPEELREHLTTLLDSYQEDLEQTKQLVRDTLEALDTEFESEETKELAKKIKKLVDVSCLEF